MENIDWPTNFNGLDFDGMTQSFTAKCNNILSQYITNKISMCGDRDPPRMTAALRSTVKRRPKVQNYNVKCEWKPDDWEYVHMVRNKTSSKINEAKDDFFSNSPKKL